MGKQADAKAADGYVWLEGRPYDARGLAKAHPGGALNIELFGGRDATHAYMSHHRRKPNHAGLLSKFSVEEKEVLPYKPAETSTASVDDPLFYELCDEVNRFLRSTGRGQGYAPPLFWFKTALLVTLTAVNEYILYTNPNVFSAVFQGMMYAFIGLNMMHCGNHGSVSKNPLVNDILGWSLDWIGGSALIWKMQHTVLHHSETNSLAHDKDMIDQPIIRFSPLRAKWVWNPLQGLYVLALEVGYAAKMIIVDWYNLILWQYEGARMSSIISNFQLYFTVGMRLLWITHHIVLPSYLNGFWNYLPYLLLHFAVAGGYLAFFFLLSHNFEGVHHIVDGKLVPADDPLGKPQVNTLLRHQVLTSSNVGSSLLAFFNGGLNYQIEHHLFPRINHCHYPAIAPVVRAFCDKHGIQYIHYSSVWSNFLSTTRFFTKQGSAPTLKRHSQ